MPDRLTFRQIERMAERTENVASCTVLVGPSSIDTVRIAAAQLSIPAARACPQNLSKALRTGAARQQQRKTI